MRSCSFSSGVTISSPTLSHIRHRLLLAVGNEHSNPQIYSIPFSAFSVQFWTPFSLHHLSYPMPIPSLPSPTMPLRPSSAMPTPKTCYCCSLLPPAGVSGRGSDTPGYQFLSDLIPLSSAATERRRKRRRRRTSYANNGTINACVSRFYVPAAHNPSSAIRPIYALFKRDNFSKS